MHEPTAPDDAQRLLQHFEDEDDPLPRRDRSTPQPATASTEAATSTIG